MVGLVSEKWGLAMNQFQLLRNDRDRKLAAISPI